LIPRIPFFSFISVILSNRAKPKSEREIVFRFYFLIKARFANPKKRLAE